MGGWLCLLWSLRRPVRCVPWLDPNSLLRIRVSLLSFRLRGGAPGLGLGLGGILHGSLLVSLPPAELLQSLGIEPGLDGRGDVGRRRGFPGASGDVQLVRQALGDVLVRLFRDRRGRGGRGNRGIHVSIGRPGRPVTYVTIRAIGGWGFAGHREGSRERYARLVGFGIGHVDAAMRAVQCENLPRGGLDAKTWGGSMCLFVSRSSP